LKWLFPTVSSRVSEFSVNDDVLLGGVELDLWFWGGVDIAQDDTYRYDENDGVLVELNELQSVF
jgi:hypothetical protein